MRAMVSDERPTRTATSRRCWSGSRRCSLREPEDREELLDILRGAFERNLLDADALSMIEGVLSVSETTVRDIMIPRAQMDCVSIDDEPARLHPARGRDAPLALSGDRREQGRRRSASCSPRNCSTTTPNPEGFNLRDTLRPAVFVPESKRLNVLLREFRANRNHIAIVVDEYGGVSGLVTIEDVLEQIVGDIEDEYDFDESRGQHHPGGERPLPREGADRDRRLQRALRHLASRTTSSTPSAAWCCARSAACPSAARRRRSKACASACCAPTAGACTRCRSSASRQPPAPTDAA